MTSWVVSARLRALILVMAVAMVSAMLAVIPAGAARAEATGSISGTVTDADGIAPVADVTVIAHPDGEAATGAFTAQTDADGQYHFSSLPSGDYRIEFQTGGAAANVIGEWWDDAPDEASAGNITVSEGGEAQADAVLSTGAILNGAVSNAEGAPIGDASVALYGADGSWFGTIQTAADGTFAFSKLRAGSYTLEFSAHTEEGHLSEWWDNAQSAEAATLIALAPAQEVSGLEVILAESDGSNLETYTASLSGRVTDGGGRPLADAQVDIIAADGNSGDGARTQADGTWSFDQMPRGSYVVAFTGVVAGETVSEFWNGAPDFESATVIDLARGQHIGDISAALSPSADFTALPSVSGEAAVGSKLTVNAGAWAAGAVLSYQWLANNVAITGATSPTITLTSSQRDKAISVRVTGSLDGYADTARSSTPTSKVVTAGTPAVSGTAATGSTLTASAGTWTSGMAYSYRWLADGVEISGATKSTFVPGTAQDGKAVTVRVTATKAGYATVSRTSKATLRVMRSSTPKITGTLAYNSTVKVDRGTWTSGMTPKYQWYADGKAISGKTSSSLKLTSGLKGKMISVKVTGTKSGHSTVAKTSAATAKVTVAATPAIAGTRAVGSTLTVARGTWASSTSFSYRWYADGKAISGATKSAYKLSSATAGKKITVVVTGKKSGYATVSKTSAATTRIMRAATPTISGSAHVTKKLTASPGTWTGGVTYSYQWYANGKAISGAKSRTLTVSSGLVGKKLTVKVTGKKSGYSTIAKTSKSTATVVYPSRTKPSTSWKCPSWAPIKGNESSMIYHMPGQRFYNATNPEECFRTESAARSAGYRKAKV